MKTKTIDIQAKEWFDKANGNSYFSAEVTINFGMKGAKTINLPVQYGYGDFYIQATGKELENQAIIKPEHYKNGFTQPLSDYCRSNKIILRTSKQENCKKRDL